MAQRAQLSGALAPLWGIVWTFAENYRAGDPSAFEQDVEARVQKAGKRGDPDGLALLGPAPRGTVVAPVNPTSTPRPRAPLTRVK